MLHWEKVNAAEGTIWGNASDDDVDVDLGNLEQMFSLEDPNAKNKKKTIDLEVKKKSTIHLIDMKRSHNISIQLAGIRVPFPQIKQGLLNMDESLSLDQLNVLQQAIPTREERNIVKNFKGDVELLGQVELYFMEVMDIPRLEQRINSLIYRGTFDANAKRVRENLRIVMQASTELKNCSNFSRVLKSILKIGNHLNAGSFKGGAQGFKLESLLTLQNVKGIDRKTSLLHFSIMELGKTAPQTLFLSDELKFVRPVSNVNLEAIMQSLSDLEVGLKLVKAEILHAAGVEEDGESVAHVSFRNHMIPFSESADDEVKKLRQHSETALAALKDTASFFGEKFLEDKPLIVFDTVSKFLDIFDKTIAEIRLEERKAEQEKKRAAEKAMRRSRSQSVIAPETSNGPLHTRDAMLQELLAARPRAEEASRSGPKSPANVKASKDGSIGEASGAADEQGIPPPRPRGQSDMPSAADSDDLGPPTPGGTRFSRSKSTTAIEVPKLDFGGLAGGLESLAEEPNTEPADRKDREPAAAAAGADSGLGRDERDGGQPGGGDRDRGGHRGRGGLGRQRLMI